MDVATVIFFSTLIGFSAGNERPATVSQYSVTITGSQAMAKCRALESKTHIDTTTTKGEVRSSVSIAGRAYIRRETICQQI